MRNLKPQRSENLFKERRKGSNQKPKLNMSILLNRQRGLEVTDHGVSRVRHNWTDFACIHLKVHTLNQSDAWIPKTLCWEKETIYKILHTVNTIWFHFYEVQKLVELINGDRNQSYCFCGVGHCLDKGTREINKQTKLLYSTASTHK